MRISKDNIYLIASALEHYERYLFNDVKIVDDNHRHKLCCQADTCRWFANKFRENELKNKVVLIEN